MNVHHSPLRWARILSLLATAVLGGLSPTGSVSAGPNVDAWPRWSVHDQNSKLAPDHSIWGRFLDTYVKTDLAGATWVNYGAVQATDRVMLGAYIVYLEGYSVRQLNRDEQLAYWINLYNALTVRLVIQHYPVNSIRDIDISPGWFADGPWGAQLTTVEGQSLSLDDIEHRILRPLWKDPRVHYAVNCASVGCPNLTPRAFTGAEIHVQLDSAARAFVNHPRGVSVVGGKVQVSSLYKWYGQDFGGTAESVLDHMRKFAADPLADMLKDRRKINTYTYNWSLNDHRDML